jgi:hypothetical protein
MNMMTQCANMKTTLLTLISLCLVACGPPTDYTSITPASPTSISKPAYVFTTSDGRKLYKVCVATAFYVDTVYMFSNGTDPVTLNRDGPPDKTYRREVIVSIP